jgi:hypothetical protein
VERIELGAERIVRWEGGDFSGTDADCVHAGDDPELRNRGERQHRENQDMTWRERAEVPVQFAIVEQ